jgi:hypothetical protein
MNLRKSILLVVSVGMIAALVACSSSSSNKNTPATVTPSSSGYTSPAPVGGPFGTLSVTVTNSDGTALSGVSVTFTAPSSGASGTFSNNTATETDTTNSSGVAMSSTFTANDTAGPYAVTATAGSATGSFNLTNGAGAAAQLAVTSGNNQTPAPGAALTALSATVEDQFGNPVTTSTASVTFTVTAGGTGATAAFSPGPTDTETAVSGVATTSQTLTANTTVGAFTVTASSSGLTSATFTETITTPPTVTAGNYVYHLAGWDTDDNSEYFVSGVVTITNSASGSAITAGEQDYIDFDNVESDQINPTGSSIVATADGNIQLILTTCSGTTCTATDTAVGVAGVETINAAFTPNNANKAYITEFDASGAASGELDIQNSTAAAATPSAGYAFVASGYDGTASPSGGGFFYAMGGVINIDGTAAMDGTGSIFDATDEDTGQFSAETFGAGTVTAPDSFGRVVFALNPTDTTNFPGPINLVGYIIDNRISLVETSDGYGGTLGGIALSQGANTGTFSSSSSSVSGMTYVFGVNGTDSNGALQSAGALTLASNGGASAIMDFNDLTNIEPASPDSFTATTSYSVDPTGDVTISGLTDSASNSFNVQFYLDGNGNALAITLDPSDVVSGEAVEQTAVDSDANFTGNYAMATFGWDDGNFDPFTSVGPVAGTGTGDTLSGTADINWADNATYTGQAFTGTYAAWTTGGILSPGTITGLDLDSSFSATDSFNFYLIDSQGDGVTIETDQANLTLGVISQQ